LRVNMKSTCSKDGSVPGPGQHCAGPGPASSLDPRLTPCLYDKHRDTLPRAMNSLTSHIRQLYDAAGSEVWISRLVFQGTTTSTPATVPPSDGIGNGRAAETAGRAPDRTDFFADPANWLDEKLIPQGDPLGFTGVRKLQIVRTGEVLWWGGGATVLCVIFTRRWFVGGRELLTLS